ncbi:MAG: HAD hydrolase family protein, partial [Cyclobacteriaceae bacterium]|nr:HAD hydrolase family protein [Cyclobacteriaceae bacterium]
YNGTLALDGKPLEHTADLLKKLSAELTIHVVTADTFGMVREHLSGFSCRIHVLTGQHQHIQKKSYVTELGPENVAAVGNGRNDREMLKVAALGIAVINEEGAGTEALLNAGIVVHSIHDALDLLIHPKRLIATLRS